jgi:hypothetical protein
MISRDVRIGCVARLRRIDGRSAALCHGPTGRSTFLVSGVTLLALVASQPRERGDGGKRRKPAWQSGKAAISRRAP